MRQISVELNSEKTPRRWYNIIPDLPSPLPPYKDSRDGTEMRSLPKIFTETASRLEFSSKRWIDIPEKVYEALIRCGRPFPLIRANRLEEHLQTCAKIYYKCENLQPVGAFKTNTAIPQAYWAMKEGYSRTVFAGSSSTRTKMAHAYAAKYFGLTPTVFMPKIDSEVNPEQVLFLREMLGADVQIVPSIEAHRNGLGDDTGQIDSMDIVRKRVEEEAEKPDAVAVISSILNHVLLTQTIMGLEVDEQISSIDEEPDTIIAPVGGGSNFYGWVAPFLRKKLRKELDVRLLAVESETSAKLTQGRYGYVRLQSPASSIFGKTYDFDMETPRPEIMGIGIQTSNTAPLLAYLKQKGFIDTSVYPRNEKCIFEAARIFLQTEGRLVAPESAYAVRAAIDEALRFKHIREEGVILLSVSALTNIDFGEKRRYLKFMK
ncbi:pyridoxal-phosphate dependent enzyme [Candidatus Bathyarchaeota archaeon]|nr:MAG: pyridoxal-phosphate dependent enzyme [Candidatus Bathyarchaeota archaeon]